MKKILSVLLSALMLSSVCSFALALEFDEYGEYDENAYGEDYGDNSDYLAGEYYAGDEYYPDDEYYADDEYYGENEYYGNYADDGLLSDFDYSYSEEYTGFVAQSTGLITDGASLLNATEYNLVSAKLGEIKANTGFETAVLTINDPGCNENTIESYCRQYYESNFGGNGACLVMCMYDRDWRFQFFGTADNTGTYDDNWITDTVVRYLSAGDYEKAFMTFAEITNDVYTKTENTKKYREFNWKAGIIIALIVGLLAAFGITGKYKKELSSVQLKRDADAYETPGSLRLTSSRDVFLYKNVSRTPIPKNNNSSRGSGSSGGGGSHGGGGKF